MQIRTLYALLELYKIQNVSKASTLLFMTQQGLSRQIKALEEELGVTLFVRRKDGVTPTEICHKLIPSFQAMCDAHTAVLNIIEEISNTGLRIGFPYGLSNCISNQFLIEYLNDFPQINVELQELKTDVCQEGLLSGKLDLALLIEPFDKTLFEYETVATDHMYAAIHRSNPLAATSGDLPLQELNGQKIITSPPDNVLVRFFDYCCNLSHIQVQRLMYSSYSIDFLNSMSRNIGIEPLTSAMAFRITNPEIRIRRLILPIPGFLYICWKRSNPNQPAARHFTSFCKNYFIRNPIPIYSSGSA